LEIGELPVKPEKAIDFRTLRLFGLEVAVMDLPQTVKWIMGKILTGNCLMHADINTFKVVQMREIPGLKQAVAAADIISADGMGIVWAAKLLGKKLPGRVTGIDLMQHLVEEAARNNKTIYLLGAKPEVVEKLAIQYSQEKGQKFVAGFHHGYFKEAQENQVAQEIAQCQPDFLFVGMTSPRKENFLFLQSEVLASIPYKMGVGGSFDVLSGMIPRAPIWIQKIGLEWAFRLSKEPVRLFKRYTWDNLRFLKLLLIEWKSPA
jgi:N-acetylglucosaminyldiphosphoundecaprenol N-acetyl-beta-D-mannosaminyltransferase